MRLLSTPTAWTATISTRLSRKGLTMRTRLMVTALALAMLSGCYAAHEAPIETVQCEPQSCAVFRSNVPYPRGRIDACELCGATEADVQARQAELGCALTSAHNGCTLGGACDYASALEHWERVRSASTCAELEALAGFDSCVRPDPRLYWTEHGGCIDG